MPDVVVKVKKKQRDVHGPRHVLPRLKEHLPPGHPSRSPLYDPALAPRAKKLALLGLTDTEIADIFSVTVDTFIGWKHNYPEFLEALNAGKIDADAEVANALYQRAIGAKTQAFKIFMPAGAATPVYAPYTEHHPPEPAAARHWLNNRQSSRWRDRKEIDLRGSIEHRIAAMTPDERRARIAELQAKAALVIEGEATEVGEE